MSWHHVWLFPYPRKLWQELGIGLSYECFKSILLLFFLFRFASGSAFGSSPLYTSFCWCCASHRSNDLWVSFSGDRNHYSSHIVELRRISPYCEASLQWTDKQKYQNTRGKSLQLRKINHHHRSLVKHCSQLFARQIIFFSEDSQSSVDMVPAMNSV